MLFTSILTSFVLALPLIQARSTPVARSTHIARAGSDVQIDFIKVVDAVSFVLGQVNTTAALEDLAAGNPQTAIVALETFGFLTLEIQFLDAYIDVENDFTLMATVAAGSGNSDVAGLASQAAEDLVQGNAAINDVVNDALTGAAISPDDVNTLTEALLEAGNTLAGIPGAIQNNNATLLALIQDAAKQLEIAAATAAIINAANGQ